MENGQETMIVIREESSPYSDTLEADDLNYKITSFVRNNETYYGTARKIGQPPIYFSTTSSNSKQCAFLSRRGFRRIL